MRLFVNFPNCGKVYLTVCVEYRSLLPPVLQVKCPKDDVVMIFVRNQVMAEADGVATIGGAIIGGLIGILAGPIGILAGGVLGGLVGSGAEAQDKEAVRRFNES